MDALTSETLFSSTVLLWAVASMVAVLLLIAASSRRKAKLTDSLRDYVDRNQSRPASGGSVETAESEEQS